MNHNLLPDVKKIAVLRATALGDLIFALPALEALHCAYPLAEIVYLGRAWHTSFLPGHLPGPHRVIAVPPVRNIEQIRQGMVIDPDAAEDFYEQMRAEGFDLVLQMHGGGEYSNPLILNMQPRLSVGLKSPRAAPLDRWLPYIYYQNEVVRMLEVAALAGACSTPVSLQPRLMVLESDLREAAPVLEKIRRPFAVLHPGSTDPRRIWSPVKFAAVADFLAGQGLEVVLTGTPMEAEQMEAVVRLAQAPLLNLYGQVSLLGLVGLLHQAVIFVGNDSGPLHLALAVGARAVGLFWVEFILNSLPLLRENFYPLIAWQRTCPLCGRVLDKAEADNPSGSCTHEVSFIEEITAADAIQGLKVLI